MSGLEKFVNLCLETWPSRTLEFTISPWMGDYRIQVRFDNIWLSPVAFGERDLAQPHAMIRTLKASMEPSVGIR